MGFDFVRDGEAITDVDDQFAIPIERAMDLTLQRGLPVRSTNAIPKAAQSSLELIQERSKER